MVMVRRGRPQKPPTAEIYNAVASRPPDHCAALLRVFMRFAGCRAETADRATLFDFNPRASANSPRRLQHHLSDRMTGLAHMRFAQSRV